MQLISGNDIYIDPIILMDAALIGCTNMHINANINSDANSTIPIIVTTIYVPQNP